MTRTIWTNFCSPIKKSPYEIWVQLAQWLQRRRCLKMLMDGRRGTDDGVIDILIALLRVFGSGELKMMFFFLFLAQDAIISAEQNHLCILVEGLRRNITVPASFREAEGWSVVCDCGISWPYSLTTTYMLYTILALVMEYTRREWAFEYVFYNHTKDVIPLSELCPVLLKPCFQIFKCNAHVFCIILLSRQLYPLSFHYYWTN